MKKLTNKKAFTLTELIVVIVIIGILAAVLVPSLTGYITKAREGAAKQEAAAVVEIHRAYLVEKAAGTLDNSITTFQAYATAIDSSLSGKITAEQADDAGFTLAVSGGKSVVVTRTGGNYTYTVNNA